MPGEHTLKCWTPYFDAIARGDKNFEVRRDDRGFQKGDILILEKYDQDKHRYVYSGTDIMAKPYAIRCVIKYILTGGQLGVEPGYVVMGIERQESNDAGWADERGTSVD